MTINEVCDELARQRAEFIDRCLAQAGITPETAQHLDIERRIFPAWIGREEFWVDGRFVFAVVPLPREEGKFGGWEMTITPRECHEHPEWGW